MADKVAIEANEKGLREPLLKESFGKKVLEIPANVKELSSDEQKQVLGNAIESTGEAFQEMVGVNLGKDNISLEAKDKSFWDWMRGYYRRLEKLFNAINSPDDTNASEDFKEFSANLYLDINHDSSNVYLNYLPAAFTSEMEEIRESAIQYDDQVWARHMKRVFGRGAEEVLGQKVVDFRLGPVSLEVFEVIGKILKAEDVFSSDEDGVETFVKKNEKQTIMCRVGKNLPNVNGTPNGLYIAVFNVARNSQKRLSNGNGDRVEIDIFRAPADWFGMKNHPEGDGIVIRIEDNAGGYPQELLQEVIGADGQKTQRAFVKGESTSGSGLGLAITRHVIENYFDGNVEARNWTQTASGKEIKGAETLLAIPASKFVQSLTS